ncbi:alpha/beta fold hydrolase [Bradyrhizobium sp. 83002]|nr:alpha/beta fold hydrolase [Bradyrhizobium aeschynomenes]NPU10833.1 alpha/beta fold hydrolase [Bradyrhizobium aeschynomenes]
MPVEFVLVAGPMVRASSWKPTADRLRAAGCVVQVPDILAQCAVPPAWSDWTRHLLDQITPSEELILVGHSSASALVADLATRLPARAIIIFDGDIPPPEGRAGPVRPALHDFIRSIAASDGTLPVWSRWFSRHPDRAAIIGLDHLALDPVALAEFEIGLPRMTIGWFNDVIHLAPWHHVPAGYVQTSPIYDHASAEARRRAWPVVRLRGTHLHPTLNPTESANAILSLGRELEVASSGSGIKAASRKTDPDRDRR